MRATVTTVLIAWFMCIVFALALSGCQTTPPQPTITRADVTRALDLGELGVGLALTYAQARGADVTQYGATATAVFDMARDAVKVNLADTDKEGLQLALNQIKQLVNDVCALAVSVGVPADKVVLIRGYAGEAFTTIEAVIASLPDDKK